MIQKIFTNLTISFKIQNKVQKDIIIDKNALCSLRNSQSQWIVGAFSSHQPTATYKTNKKTTVAFRHPSDGKVSYFFGKSSVRTVVILIENVLSHLV